MSETLTPMMQQYQGIRRTLTPDTLLLFRLGDFYEMFFEDAKEGSAILNVALTKRNSVPMCGIPYHAIDSYMRKLIKAGKRVAICDQVGEVTPGRIVQREITQIISPGTVSDIQMLDSKRNNYLAAVFEKSQAFGIAYIDLMTGEFRLTELQDEKNLLDELQRVQPAETLHSDEQSAALAPLLPNAAAKDAFIFLPDHARQALLDHFGTHSLDGFGCEDMPLALNAAGAIVHYLRHEMRRNISHVTRLSPYRHTQFMVLDAATQSNLDLVGTKGERSASLLGALDRTVTQMGARRLRDWVLHPLRDLVPIVERQEMVAALIAEPFLLGKFRESLGSIRDIERTVGRLTQTGGNARDILVLRTSLEQVPTLREDLAALFQNAPPPALAQSLLDNLHPLPHLVEMLQKAMVEEPPATTKEGGMFRDAWSPQLDELRCASRDGRHWIAELQQREIDTTGIKSLKVRYTSVFGYFIEVTKSNLHLVPDAWTRKQTVATGERFITPELKEVENKILGADERAQALEYDLFAQLRTEILRELEPLQNTASAIATLDALASFAETARLFSHARPALDESSRILIKEGRHPVLDQQLAAEKFVPNDVDLDHERARLLIITGPNMAGKSTYIRQVALIVLMAQIGAFVPAKSAEIGIADRIFTRVGASDDLSRGQSTFMVEMNETANIMNNATERSLIILDEIGRGTSTFDGLSIAWSVAEYLHDTIKARTLFATHYHELTELEMTRPAVRNFNVAVREWNDQIIFLRKIIPGGADKSYGIQVARLAGLPPEVVARAKDILNNLEQAELNADGRPALAEAPPAQQFGKPKGRKKAAEALATMKPQMTLF